VKAATLAALGIAVASDDEPDAEGAPRVSLSAGEVECGPEFLRISNLDRRPIPDAASDESIELAEFLTRRLARVRDPYPGSLRPLQAVALKEAWTCKGLVGMLATGAGKSLSSYLLPTVLQSKRPLYVCPGSIKGDMAKEFRKYAQSWHGPSMMPILSYEALSQPAGGRLVDDSGKVLRGTMLERINPDLVIFDEAHRAKALSSTTTKRIKAFRKAHPECIFVALTGTPYTASIKDIAHLMDWCLGDQSPLPRDFEEREQWASFLDAKSKDVIRVRAGALLAFNHGEGDTLQSSVRLGLATHIFETAGVIGTAEPPCAIPLRIEAVFPTDECPNVEAAIEELNNTWRLPDGTDLADPMQLAAQRKNLGLNFWTKLVPPPPDAWRTARSAWARWCRDVTQSPHASRKGWDSEATVAAAVRRGVVDDGGLLEAWEAQMWAERERTGLREPPSECQWISDEIFSVVGDWIDAHGELIWVNSIGLGQRIAREFNIPYYQNKGFDARGRHIRQHPAHTPVVVSIKANGTGTNLQHQWSKNLWLTPPSEQPLARTHRPGQDASVVDNYVYIGCYDHYKAFCSARNTKAKFAEEMQRNAEQKIRAAEIVFPTNAEITSRGGARWSPT
jgi:hypothetical protein